MAKRKTYKIPMVAIGFMYPQGYFRQHISAEAEQVEEYAQIKFSEAPISPCPWPQGCGPFIPIQLADHEVYVKVWLVKVGRVDLFLLDTDVDLNEPQDRTLSARLYTADQEERIRQLIVLGVGGVRTLRELKIVPNIWHANEDHTAFMMLERLREELINGVSFEKAVENIRKTTIFTTHTPVPAGQHIFSDQIIDYYLHNFWETTNLDRDIILKLGKYDDLHSESFSLTALALRLAHRSNAVSKLHRTVSMKMWNKLWSHLDEKEKPLTFVTNGIHLPSWQTQKILKLCEKYSGKDLLKNQTDQKIWQYIANVPDEEFWEIRQQLKNKLVQTIRDRAQKRWTKNAASSKQVIAMGALLDPYSLTIAFTRRFTSYKRPHLILSDIERIKKIITDPLKPVQIIFAGKSHPADHESKQLLKYVYRLAMDDSFLGKIVFVEDYDMSLARDLVQGADVWLNNPRRLQEACGTSGMKASMNGIINFSILDGWWAEAYQSSNGWAIGTMEKRENQEQQDKADADSIYNLLETEIVPLYYDRDVSGIPHRWIKKR
ncbi:MAG: alpha-glucan family phosphorylase, partial [Candidatus Bathyarchaeota archaeon]